MNKILLITMCLILAHIGAFAQNEHWSRQFEKPNHTYEMLQTTGMSDGVGTPTVSQVKWHDGKLWFSGNWESGVSGDDPTQTQLNEYWNLWTWSAVDGWEAVVYYHTAQGGVGPMGVINDFFWLPDGRLVVGGEFTRIDNPGGVRYREVQALAVYNKNEPTANKWQPLGTFQYNGTVSGGGSIYHLAYDTQANDMYIVGTFGGIPGTLCNQIHRYDFDTQSYEPLKGGVYGTNPKFIKTILVDETTTPSTLYIGGSFKWVGGNGDEPAAGGTAIYTDAVASYQEGRDGGFGWQSYGTTLTNAASFMFNTSATVQDLALINGDLWIVGAFHHESDVNIQGIAKWNGTDWVDPTGKGGVGRDIFSIEEATNGKIYFAGAFGGRSGYSTFYDGFANGDNAHMTMSYNPNTTTWDELGNGLFSNVMPECHLVTNGNDVYYTGDFEYFDAVDGINSTHESYYIARWNETLDFTSAPIISGTKTATTLTINVDGGSGTWTYALDGGASQSNNTFDNMTTGLHYVVVTNGTYTDTIWAEFKENAPTEVAIGGDENIHWSREFPDPIAYNEGTMDETTGMKGSLTRSTGMEWYDGKLYFTGHLDSWYVWYFDPASGWAEVTNTFSGPPEGMKWHNDKLYVWGAMGTAWKGMAVYDPSTTSWSTVSGTYNGNAVVGTGTTDGASGVVRDVKWDASGNMYVVGNWAPGTDFPGDMASALKISPSGIYETLGTFISEYEPGHAKGLFTILLDETQTPMDMYVGGTFKYARGGTLVENETYNVAKWDPSLNSSNGDWGKLGVNADGDAGLPPVSFIGFEMNNGDAVVRTLAIDNNGNLYAGGSLAIYDSNPVIADRVEDFGLVKYDKLQNKWISATNIGGVTRDVYQMTWMDANTLLLSGSFNYGDDFSLLGNAAKLNTTTGELTAFGGGLVREGMDQTIGSTVVHTVKNNEIYFFGFFNHAGVNANSNLEAPNSSSYIAMWDGSQSLDPNENLFSEREINVCVSSPYSSENVEITFTATGAGTGTYHWFETNGSNEFEEIGTGSTYVETIYAGAGDTEYRYVSVESADGVMGGKLSVAVNFIHDDIFNAMTPTVSYSSSTHELTCSMVGLGYEWYLNGSLISGADTRAITATVSGNYSVKVISHSCTTQESDALSVNVSGIENTLTSNKLITVYPNPSNGIFTINAKDEYNIIITDISGRQIKNLKINNGSINVNLTNQSSGIYFVRYSNNKNIGTVKIIKK